jgi:hypothetical protein
MARFTHDNTEGYSDHDLKVLNERLEEAIHLPIDTLLEMNEIEIGSWHDHCAERVLADFDANASS